MTTARGLLRSLVEKVEESCSQARSPETQVDPPPPSLHFSPTLHLPARSPAAGGLLPYKGPHPTFKHCPLPSS